MDNARKKSMKVLSFMLSFLLLYGSVQPAVLIPTYAADTSNSSAEKSSLVIDLKSVTTESDTNAYIVATFSNDRTDLIRIAQNGVTVNGKKLNYNSSYSYISYANSGDCIVSGNTISFYTSSLSEGENTVTFTNPDGEDVSVRLKMTKTGGSNWWESASYTVEVLSDEAEDETEPASGLTVDLQDVTTENSTNNYVSVSFNNEYADLVRIAQNGVTVNGQKLNYNSSYNNLYYANVGDCIVTGNKICFYTASLSDGENTVIFTNPDGADVSVRLNMSKTGDYWSGYSYNVEVMTDTTEPETQSETESETETEYESEQTLYVRLVGNFEHRIVGQQDDVDAVSSASTGGSSYISSSSSAHVEYALVSEDTTLENVPEDAWKKPDYFKNGDLLQVNGANSKIVIEPECSGIYGEINAFSGDLFLRGVPEKAGTYKVSVYLDTDKGNATSNTLDFEVYTGNEKLSDQLTYENCTQTADGKYMFDNKPWYITDFGGENQTVTVPKDIKAWYGSHAVLPEVNYSEIGKTISLTNGEEPVQTLIIPDGCNLTMVNMRIHSGVKIIVENGAKLTLRQSTVEGIIEVQNGGTFSMDYNDYGDGEWLHGSSINGQLQMKDGSILENARITCHANYSARDDEDRRNFAPLVTTEGNVTIKGDVYILGEEAPTGETAQTALKINGTLTLCENSVLACYGGGTSFLTADGGDAIELDNGTITGNGSVIAIGGYGMNITGDKTKGSGGAAVSGNGRISTANAYLEGGASYHDSTAPLKGAVKIADTTNRKLVDGKGNTTEKSKYYWSGTGDANGIVPQVEKTLAQIPQNAPAVSTGKNVVKVTINWTDGAENHVNDVVTVNVKDKNGNIVKTAEVTAQNDWNVTVSGLDETQSYTVETSGFSDEYAVKTTKAENTQGDTWEVVPYGEIEENETYLITYEESAKTYILGVQDGVIGTSEWDSSLTPDVVPDGFKWIPAKAKDYYDNIYWYLMNQDGNKDKFLSVDNSGGILRTKGSSWYYGLVVDTDGSVWNDDMYHYQLAVKNNKLDTVSMSSSDFTPFTFYKKVTSNADEFTISAVSYTRVEAKEPTHQETGNIAYYIGSDGKYYLSNGEDNIETTLEDVTIAAIPCKVTITSGTGGSIRVLAEYDDENGGTQLSNGAEVPYGTKLTVIREMNTGFALADGSSYKIEEVTVNDDVEITLNAVTKTYQLNVIAENGSYTANVADVNSVPYGTNVTLTAGEAENGYEFVGWYQPNGKQLSANKKYTVGMTSDYFIEARYQKNSGVVSFMSNNSAVKTMTVDTGSFSESDFPASPNPMYGFVFTGWSMSAEEINTALENGDSITVNAVFAPVKNNFKVTVYNGDSETPEEINCTESKVITCTAEAVDGRNFAYWTLDGTIFSYNKTVSYRANGSGTLTAVYSKEAVKANGTANVGTASYNADNQKLTINAYLTVPDGCTITSAGLVASSSEKFNPETDELTASNAEFDKVSAAAVGKSAPVSYTWNKSNVKPGDVWYVRAHIAYTDTYGETHDIYSNLMTITAGCDYDSAEKGTAAIRTAAYEASTKKATFNAYLTVPDGAVVVNAGLVAASSKTFNPANMVLTSANAEFTKSSSVAVGKSAPVSYTWNKSNVNSGDVWYARAYLVYTLDGVEHTVYGTLTTLTAE